MTKDEQHAYRSDVVELFRESGMSQKAFAESYGIARSTLGIWIKEIQNDAIETRTSCVSVGAIGRHRLWNRNGAPENGSSSICSTTVKWYHGQGGVQVNAQVSYERGGNAMMRYE